MPSAQDLEHLRLLSIFHYVLAGIVALVSLIPSFHLAFGITLATRAAEPDPMAAVVGWFIAGMGALMIGMAWALALGLALAGGFIARRTNYTFCVVVAGVACLFAPFGTVLGVLTLVVLLKPEVRELFAPKAA